MTITSKLGIKILIGGLAIGFVVGWLIYLAQPSQEVKDINHQVEVIKECEKLREQLNMSDDEGEPCG